MKGERWSKGGHYAPTLRQHRLFAFTFHPSPFTWLSAGARLLDEIEDFTGGRVTAHRLLGEDRRAIQADVEDAAGGLNQAYFSIGKGFLQLGGQTGRPGLVVSNDAILDGDAH